MPAGTVGEIAHRSPHLMLGYLDDPAKTAEAFRGGWFHSGDLGYYDEFGLLHVVDRKKDMIKSGGENVASREVEEALYRHEAVQEVAVFGVPHPVWVECRGRRGGHQGRPPSSTEADLIAHCRERIWPATRHPSGSSSSTHCPRIPAASCSSANSGSGSTRCSTDRTTQLSPATPSR